MRLLTIMIGLLFTLVSLYANDIDEQIRKIQLASPKERYKLVNQLKEQIAHLNELEQTHAISKYQETNLNHQQAKEANQHLIEESLKREEKKDILVPQPQTLPIPTPKKEPILPPKNPVTPTIPKKTEPPTPTYEQPNYKQPEHEAPAPDFKNPDYAIPTPQPSYEKPEYDTPTVPTPKETEIPSIDEVPAPEPTYDTPEPEQEIPKTIPKLSPSIPKRGGF